MTSHVSADQARLTLDQMADLLAVVCKLPESDDRTDAAYLARILEFRALLNRLHSALFLERAERVAPSHQALGAGLHIEPLTDEEAGLHPLAPRPRIVRKPGVPVDGVHVQALVEDTTPTGDRLRRCFLSFLTQSPAEDEVPS